MTAYVDYDPWLRVEVGNTISGTVTDDTFDATAEADIEVSVNGTATVTVAKYAGNPGSGFGGDIGKYVDVYVDDVSAVNEIEIRLYYTNGDISGKVESSLRLYWWDGSTWAICSDTGVNMAAVNGYSGYIWAKIRDDTTPSLNDLSGTPFGATASTIQDGGGGGGGGGGGDTTSLSEYTTGTGKFVIDATASSADGMVKIEIPKDTVGKDRNGGRLRFITIKKQDAPAESPTDCEYVCLAYSIGPTGATLEPFGYLVFFYDDSNVPADVAEGNMVLVTWQDGAWVELEDCVVDPGENSITAPISHFSVFTAIAHTSPASIGVAGMTVTPSEVQLGAPVAVSVTATNSGDLTDNYTVVLKVNNTAVQEKLVTLKGGESQKVSFTVTQDIAGEYIVSVGGLSGKFTVKEPEPEGKIAEAAASEPPAPSPTPTPTPQPAVEPAPAPQPEPEPEPTAEIPVEPTAEGIAWWLILIYVVAGVIVIGGGVYYFMRRRSTA